MTCCTANTPPPAQGQRRAHNAKPGWCRFASFIGQFLSDGATVRDTGGRAGQHTKRRLSPIESISPGRVSYCVQGPTSLSCCRRRCLTSRRTGRNKFNKKVKLSRCAGNRVHRFCHRQRCSADRLPCHQNIGSLSGTFHPADQEAEPQASQ